MYILEKHHTVLFTLSLNLGASKNIREDQQKFPFLTLNNLTFLTVSNPDLNVYKKS